MDASYVKVTSSGQVSLPAAVRRRWGVGSVLVIDRGDHAVIRPVPDDPVAALQGIRRGPGPSSDEARALDRAEPDRSDP